MLRSSPLFQLYLVRLRDFYRQPARVFWVYGFPDTAGDRAGIRLQESPARPDPCRPDRGPRVGPVKAHLEQHNAAFLNEQKQAGKPPIERPAGRDPRGTRRRGFQATEHRQDAPGDRTDGLRVVDLPLRPARDPMPARPVRRSTISCRSRRSHQPGQTKDVIVSEPGSRYIDFLIPGLIGLNAMGGGLWGIGFLLVNFRIAKLLKRFVATPMPRRDFLLALLGGPAHVRDSRPGSSCSFWERSCSTCRSAAAWPSWSESTCSARSRSPESACWSPAVPVPPRRSAG